MRRKQAMEVLEMDGKTVVELFFEDKKSLNLSEQTLSTYRLHLDYFLEAYGKYFDSKHFNANMWKELLLTLSEDENKTEQTVLSYCRTIRAFFYWCQDHDYSPVCQLKLPKASERIKEIYTDNELVKLLERPSKDCSEVTYQTYVFISFIMSTGLRLSSALSLLVSDFIKKENLIYIQQTKKRQGFRLRLSDEMTALLSEYIRLFDLENDNHLFCVADGSQMAKRTMQDNVATYNKKRGVDKTSIHLFRHTYAVKYYQATHDVYALMLQLQHSNIATTQRYLRSLSVDIVDNSEKFNPLVQYSKTTQKKKRRGKM